MEEKFRKAMVANASLDNEKSQLMFQVCIFHISNGNYAVHRHTRLIKSFLKIFE